MFCSKCGKQLPDGAKFCGVCGTPVLKTGAQTQVPAQPMAQPQIPAQQAPMTRTQVPQQQAPMVQAQIPAQQAPMAQAQVPPQTVRFTAPAGAGEAAMGVLQSGAAAAVRTIPGAGSVLGSTITRFFASIGSAFKDPKRLIPALVLAVVWLVLDILTAVGVVSLPTSVLSFLTFARGGLSGGIAGAVGGLLGKGLLAGAVTSVVGLMTRKKTGEKSSGNLFSRCFGVSGDSAAAWVTGIGLSLLLYSFISGGATGGAFMAGVAASYLAARSALTNGFVQRLAASLTSKGKAVAGPGAAGFVRGLSVGFALAAAMSFVVPPAVYLIGGGVILGVGLILLVLQALGVIGKSKGARA